MTTQRICNRIGLSLLTAVLCATGCAEGLFRDHMANDRKARAKQQWETMRANVKIQVAENHFQSGRLDEASKAIEEALRLDGENVKAYMLSTRIEIERGELSKAKEHIQTAMSYAYDNPEVRYIAGMVAERYDDIQGALDHYTAASESAPLVVEYLLARVEMLAASARDVDAMELLEARMSDFDGNAPLRALAANECRRLGLRGPAIDYGREALRLCPKDRAMKAELADTLAWAEEFDEAIKLYQSLLIAPPQDDDTRVVSESSIRIRLAAAQLANRQARQALATLRPAIAGNSNDATALSLYARAAVAAGDFDAAEGIIRRLHEQCRVTPESLMLLVLVQQHKGDEQGALKTAKRLIEVEGETADGYVVLGRTLERNGNTAEACDVYRKALRIDPAFAPARLLLDRLEPPMAAVTPDAIVPAEIENAPVAKETTSPTEPPVQAEPVVAIPSAPTVDDAIADWMGELNEQVAAGAGEEGP